jgi:hypothetical protein
MKNLILKVLKEQKDGFITPNQTDFNHLNTKEFFTAIYELIQEGILRKRNCEGLAYEFNK